MKKSFPMSVAKQHATQCKKSLREKLLLQIIVRYTPVEWATGYFS